jgi:hypothetical protein
MLNHTTKATLEAIQDGLGKLSPTGMLDLPANGFTLGEARLVAGEVIKVIGAINRAQRNINRIINPTK